MTKEEAVSHIRKVFASKYADEIIKAIETGPRMPQSDMTSSHSEKETYDGCISLMKSLVSYFYEWLDYAGIDISDFDNEDNFCVHFYPTWIVERLFLQGTSHSGGTSQRMKCRELGIDEDALVIFNFDELEKGNEK